MAERPVVSDTTPLIKLAGVGLLDLLPQLYGEVEIPEAVRDEYRAGARPADPRLEALSWLRVRAVVPEPELAAILGLGEAAAITLASGRDARVVLLDERVGRRLARGRELPVVGTLAVLVRAKRQGLIPAVGLVVDKMVDQGRRIGGALRTQVLREAGEL
ncbi:MAG TPA: DUF3368 domain-containing protein [Chloroflexota bacterium]|nr:DUF3368 domain-containing protein [Chloroflexota bacterium]